MTTLKVICSGHIAERNGHCKTCRVDEFNAQCPDYKAIRYGIFTIQGESDIMKVIDRIEQTDEELEAEFMANYKMVIG